MLLGGIRKEEIRIETPAGVSYRADVEDISVSEKSASCAVRKDAGDDPDVTNGILIYSKVSFVSEDLKAAEIRIRGGSGVGRVTRPGLDQEAGCAAINSVPRKMIEKEVREVMDFFGFRGTLDGDICAGRGGTCAEDLQSETWN
jgi:cobalt-precorrin-5B (C1)-methyltransferase